MKTQIDEHIEALFPAEFHETWLAYLRSPSRQESDASLLARVQVLGLMCKIFGKNPVLNV